VGINVPNFITTLPKVGTDMSFFGYNFAKT